MKVSNSELFPSVKCARFAFAQVLQFTPLTSCRLCVFPSASAHQRLLLVPPSWDPLHGGQRGEKETLAQGG